ncbi:hypothetical protein ABI59_06665 [Acidobacteria bacterium Mor1]|nr:hypothetical protein ABI59_06665 [Acidobacteria bacterium Mor1]
MFRTSCLLLIVMTAGILPAQAQESAPDPLTRLIESGHRGLRFGEAGPQGPGAEFLVESGAAAHFFLIGESHGNPETPALSSWLAGRLNAHGYRTLAVETGPVAAQRMKRLAAEPQPMEAFQQFHQRWPLSIAFFFWKEEVQMLLEVRELGWDVVGLDQEFVGAGRYLLDELHGLVQAPQERAQVEKWQQQAAAGMQKFMETGDTGAGFLNSIDTESLDGFAAALPADARQARRIVQELSASATVYQHYQNKRYYLNNYDRIQLMKRHLAEYIAEAGGLESAPKMLFKFGSAHMGRGYSPFHQLDLGNAAAELAVARLSDSFHLDVTALASVRNGEERDWTAESPYLARFAAAMGENAWGVFDLRPLRPFFAAGKNREAHPELAELVYRFDALAVAPKFHEVEAMIPLPF